MISAQIDELRKAALIQGAHARYDVANLLTDAADTILSLRDRAQDLQAENAKLREFVAGMWRLFVEHCDMDESHLAEVDAVRDGLRELGIEVDDVLRTE